MATVGEQLRTAREAQKLDVYRVAEVTKIRTDHIRALEAGDYDQFVAPVYIRGFVRGYATLLKLDVPQIMAALNAELGQTEKFSEPPALSPVNRTPVDVVMLQLSRVNWQKAGILVVGLALVGAIGGGFYAWWHRKTADPLAGLKPPLYQSTQSVSGDVLPLPPPSKAKP
jgi:cytoskeletal protein RodZ